MCTRKVITVGLPVVSITVLLATRPLWMLSQKSMPQHALVTMTLLVTVTFVQSLSKASIPCRTSRNGIKVDVADDPVAVEQDVREGIADAWRLGPADDALHGVKDGCHRSR